MWWAKRSVLVLRVGQSRVAGMHFGDGAPLHISEPLESNQPGSLGSALHMIVGQFCKPRVSLHVSVMLDSAFAPVYAFTYASGGLSRADYAKIVLELATRYSGSLDWSIQLWPRRWSDRVGFGICVGAELMDQINRAVKRPGVTSRSVTSSFAYALERHSGTRRQHAALFIDEEDRRIVAFARSRSLVALDVCADRELAIDAVPFTLRHCTGGSPEMLNSDWTPVDIGASAPLLPNSEQK